MTRRIGQWWPDAREEWGTFSRRCSSWSRAAWEHPGLGHGGCRMMVAPGRTCCPTGGEGAGPMVRKAAAVEGRLVAPDVATAGRRRRRNGQSPQPWPWAFGKRRWGDPVHATADAVAEMPWQCQAHARTKWKDLEHSCAHAETTRELIVIGAGRATYAPPLELIRPILSGTNVSLSYTSLPTREGDMNTI